MSYGRTITYSLPRLANYQVAAAYEAKIVPIRRDKNNTKPLGTRKAKYVSIKREEPSGDILLCLHGYEYLRYHARGNKITITPLQYSHQGINQLIDHVLGVRVGTFDGAMWVQCSTKEFADGQVPIKTKTTFKNRARSLGYCGGLFLAKPEYPVVRTINRKKANEARKAYKGFLKQALGTLKLLNEPAQRLENQYSHGGFYLQPSKQLPFHQLAAQYLPQTDKGNDYYGRPQVDFGEGGWQREVKPFSEILALALSESQEEQLRATLYLTGRALRSSYGETPSLMAAFKRAFDMAFVMTNPHVLQKTKITTGKRVKDRFGFMGS